MTSARRPDTENRHGGAVAPALKRLAARAGRGRMFARRLPQDLGGCRFPASLEGGARYLRLRANRFDPVLTSFAKMATTTGAVVWDVGANVGLFTFVAAGLAGPTGTVVAVEPDYWLAANLRRASQWNPESAEIIVIPAAISDRVGLTDLVVAKNNRAANYITAGGGSPVTGGARERHTVPTLTLNCLAESLPMPDVLKIDVEGAEVLVLAGADHVLDNRPTIFIETGERTSAAVHHILAGYGYSYIDASTGRSCDMPVFNTIATAAR